MSVSHYKSSELELDEKGNGICHVHFDSIVSVKVIPSRKSYFPDDEARMWFSLSDLNEMAGEDDIAMELLRPDSRLSCRDKGDEKALKFEHSSPVNDTKARLKRNGALDFDISALSRGDSAATVSSSTRSRRPVLKHSNEFAAH